MTSRAVAALRFVLARPLAWLLVLLVAVGVVLRLAAVTSPAADVSPAAFASVDAPESPVCDATHETLRVTGDLEDAALLRAARPPTTDEAHSTPRLRAGSLPYDACAAFHAGSLSRARLALADASRERAPRAESPARKRARLMVFLN